MSSEIAVSTSAAIICPVAAVVRVRDVARSIAFYRDILQFQPTEPINDFGITAAAEMVRAPARIQFEAAAGAGEDIVFFETNDVAAMRSGIAARGAKPGKAQRVNWIKMEMFEVRDPDGNVLWFGKSFAEPGCGEQSSDTEPLLRQIMPELPLTDVAAGMAYYKDVLGFRVDYSQDDLAVMDRDKVRVLLIGRTEKHTGIGSAYVYVENVDGLCEEFRSKGANVLGDPVSRPWGLREVFVLDPEGNCITFAQTFE